MKTLRTVLGAFAVVAMLGLVPAFGQSTMRITADVPFAFTAGDKAMPAGQYTFVAAPNSAIAYLYDQSGKRGTAFMTNGASPNAKSDEAVLKFNVYGNKSYFAGAFSGMRGAGRSLVKSRGEKEVERASAQSDVTYIRAGLQ